MTMPTKIWTDERLATTLRRTVCGEKQADIARELGTSNKNLSLRLCNFINKYASDRSAPRLVQIESALANYGHPTSFEYRARRLSSRAYHILYYSGVQSEEDIRRLGYYYFLRSPNSGVKTVKEIGDFIGGWPPASRPGGWHDMTFNEALNRVIDYLGDERDDYENQTGWKKHKHIWNAVLVLMQHRATKAEPPGSEENRAA